MLKRVLSTLSSAPPPLPSDSAFLSKGLNYSLGANKINIPFFSAFEPIINHFSYEKKHLISSVIANSLIKFNPKKIASTPLPADPFYIFTKTDKGRCIVILN